MNKFKIICLFISLMLFTICASCTKEQNPNLVVCIDAQSENQIKELIRVWEQFNDGTKAELIIIPNDATAAETKITELRTEIMSGKGPDVFILNCTHPNAVNPVPVLFSNPEKMMYADIFLPLDDYINNAEYMQPNTWNQKIMAAGRTDEGQLLLPLYYEYYAYAFNTADLQSVSKLPSSWDELMVCDDAAVMNTISQVLFLEFHNIFGRLSNYQSEELMYTENELLMRTQQAMIYTNQKRNIDNASEPVSFGPVGDSFITDLASYREENHTIFALPNIDGGITANVTMYAAINRNTASPEKAFSLLDILFSNNVMCNQGFTDGERILGAVVMPLSMAIPANNDVLQMLCSKLTSEDAAGILNMNNQINIVRFNSDLDLELLNMYENYRNTQDENRQKEIVIQTLTKLQMMLAE